jgi:hypothetical protein
LWPIVHRYTDPSSTDTGLTVIVAIIVSGQVGVGIAVANACYPSANGAGIFLRGHPIVRARRVAAVLGTRSGQHISAQRIVSISVITRMQTHFGWWLCCCFPSCRRDHNNKMPLPMVHMNRSGPSAAASGGDRPNGHGDDTPGYPHSAYHALAEGGSPGTGSGTGGSTRGGKAKRPTILAQAVPMPSLPYGHGGAPTSTAAAANGGAQFADGRASRPSAAMERIQRMLFGSTLLLFPCEWSQP